MILNNEAQVIKLSDIIAPSFIGLHKALKENLYTDYFLSGGRGSCKSSFTSVEIVLNLMNDPTGLSNALVLRKVSATISSSVFEQITWAINKLGVSHLWRAKISPFTYTYLPTGQKILFRGADNPRKLKSIKVSKGYIKYIWYEEVDEFGGMAEIDNINQSALRGGSDFVAFYSFNPPKSAKSWINSETALARSENGRRIVHQSDYRSVPAKWLGPLFIEKAKLLEKQNPMRYRHEYLGEAVGSQAEVFRNLELRSISDKEIEGFDRIYRGLDWGYGADPFAYVALYFQRNTRTLYIFYEYYKCGAKFDSIAEAIRRENKHGAEIRAESAEPRSNDELRDRGIRIRAVKKGAGSVNHGVNWLQNLNRIVIDPIRCPNTAREFSGYELESDGNGGYRDGFPDKDNHSIDAVRYALEDVTAQRKIAVRDKSKYGVY